MSTATSSRVHRPAVDRPSLLALATGGIGTAVFALLAEDARDGGGLAHSVDPTVLTDAVHLRSSALTPLAEGLTTVGGIGAVLALGAVVVGLLVWRRRLTEAVALVGGLVGAAGLTFLAKLVVARHRPATTYMMDGPDAEFSFPSGHTLMTTALVGLLAVVVWRLTENRVARAAATLAAPVLAVGVGLSRLYLGYHWFSDVLGSWVIGSALVLTVVVALRLWDRARA